MTTTLAERIGVCGCCAGIGESTPASVFNLPGLSTLAYRVGTHARFKQSMLLGLSQHSALRRLTTRDDDDPTIALVDAWAAALDVLTFYQERLANEAYLRTALEQRSIRELARAIGYELGPGVAADTNLVFELETAPGAPDSALLKAGTKVQSVPGQDELPQTYETVEEIEARPEWNAFQARTRQPTPSATTNELYLAGIATNLRVGDRLLLVAANGEWANHRLTDVREDSEADVTRVAWKQEFGWPGDLVLGPDTPALEAFALRVRAALFGYNAPDWKAMPDEIKDAYEPGVTPHNQFDWPNLSIAKVGRGTGQNTGTNGNAVFLDGIYPQVVTDSWAVLRAPGLADGLYTIENSVEDARTDFTMSAKTTRLDLGVTHQSAFDALDKKVREITVFAHSEKLELAAWPVTTPVGGAEIHLAEPIPPLPEGRRVIVSGTRARAELVHWGYALKLYPDDGSHWIPVAPHEVFELLGPFTSVGGKPAWHVVNAAGIRGTLPVAEKDLVHVPPPDDAPLVVELAATGKPVTDDDLQETLVLAESLANAYEPGTVSIAANVARATHGESRTELLGGGNAAVPFQRFALKDSPLTYVQGGGSTGATTTLAVRVQGVLWHEARAFYGHGPRDRVYAVRLDDAGTAAVEFGDGTTGARLPTGAQNVRATYRVGTGLAGQVGGGRLTTLLGAPLGVKAVTNPLPSTGADDPEQGDRARENAPLTVRAFERVVSLDDVEAFAAAFAGVGKAQATRLWDGEVEIVHLTIGLADGTPPKPGAPTLANLRKEVKDAGDPHLRIQIDPFLAWPFAVDAEVIVHPDYEEDVVLDAVRATLLSEFSFERRAFAQSVFESEVIATMQRVQGVEAVDLRHLHLVGEYTMLPAERARFFAGKVIPAQLLTLSPDHVAVTAA